MGDVGLWHAWSVGRVGPTYSVPDPMFEVSTGIGSGARPRWGMLGLWHAWSVGRVGPTYSVPDPMFEVSTGTG